MISVLQACSSSPADQRLAYKAITAMCDVGFLAAVGRAATGLVTTAQLARSETTAVRQLHRRDTDYGTADAMVRHEVLAAMAVEQVNFLAKLAADMLLDRFETEVPHTGSSGGGSGRGGGSGGGSGRGGGSSGGSGSVHITSIPSDLDKHITVVLNSRLGVTAAGAIVMFPDAAALPSRSRNTIREWLCEAARKAVAGMFKMDTLRNKLLMLPPPTDLKVLSLMGNLQHAARQPGFQLLKVGVAGADGPC